MENSMTMKHYATIFALIASTTAALAHAPKVGHHGGPQADAGSFHVEVVPQGTSLQVFLRDHSDKPVLTENYKGTAIFVMDGKPQRILLMPAGENKLTGTSTVTIPSEPQGAVQITTPTGSTIQAKFN